MNAKDGLMIILMFVVFGVPALALAARLVIRPMLDAIDRFRETTVSARQPDPRIAEMEAELSRLSVEVQRLSESEAFHRQLLAAPPNDMK